MRGEHWVGDVLIFFPGSPLKVEKSYFKYEEITSNAVGFVFSDELHVQISPLILSAYI